LIVWAAKKQAIVNVDIQNTSSRYLGIDIVVKIMPVPLGGGKLVIRKPVSP